MGIINHAAENMNIMPQQSSRRLLEALDAAAASDQFPLWCFETDYTFVGAMCASGYTSAMGEALVFETFEYDVRQGAMESTAACFAAFPLPVKARHYGNGVSVPSEILTHPETGQVLIDYGDTIKIQGRSADFNIVLERNALIAGHPFGLDDDQQKLVALLFALCATLPRDELFPTPTYVREVFDLSPDTRRLFVVEQWEHPPVHEYLGEPVKPGACPDVIAMAEALCAGNPQPRLTGTPNTDWRTQWLMYPRS